MRIVLAVHHFPPRYTAGAELYTYRLARWLNRAGHEAEVVCVESVQDGDLTPRCVRDVYDGVPVYRLHINLKEAPDPVRWQFWNPQIGSWFADFLRAARPDLVHLNSCYLLSASIIEAVRGQSIPIVLTLHDFWFLCPRITLQRPDGSLCKQAPADPAECAWCLLTEKRRYRLPEVASAGMLGRLMVSAPRDWPALARLVGLEALRGALEERRRCLSEALQSVDMLIAPSQFLRGMFVQQGVPAGRIRFSRCGLDVGIWQDIVPVSERWGSQLRVGYIGQLAPHKGVHVLLRAFRRLRTTDGRLELRVYGDPARFPRYVTYLRRLAARDKRIVFEGVVENTQIPRILTALDVVVVPSKCYENSPFVILEAQAAGVPVIASNLGGMAELVQHGVNGLLFEAGNNRDLARQIQRLLDEPGLLGQLREGIRPPRTMENEMQELLQTYALVSSGRGSSDSGQGEAVW